MPSLPPTHKKPPTTQQMADDAIAPPPPITITTTSRAREEPEYDSSCSSNSVTPPDSRRSWISDVSCSFDSGASDCASTISTSSSCYSSSSKPHKANQADWEAIRRLRTLTAGRVGLDHFRLVRRLGSGDLGNVYLCSLREPRLSGCLYAMKVVDRDALAFRKKLQRAEMEKDILAMLDHPFLPTLYADFDAAHYSCLVMEFCPGGDLHVLRQRQPGRRFPLSSARFYAAEILLALEYLHMMGVVYRDLKPENVLVRADGHIMLSDFDLSFKCHVVPKLLRQQKASALSASDQPEPGDCNSRVSAGGHQKRSSSSCVPPMQPVLSCLLFGSGGRSCRKTSPAAAAATASVDGAGHDAAAAVTSTAPPSKVDELVEDDEDYKEERELVPELVAEPISAKSRSFVGTHEYLAPEVISGHGHGSAVDWWTLGVFLYELLYGRTPFKGEDNEKTLVNIMKQPLRFPKLNDVQGMSGRELEEMARAQDLIGKLLVKNPKKRIGSSRGSVEIKRHDFFRGVNWALIRSVRPPDIPQHNDKMPPAAVGGARQRKPPAPATTTMSIKNSSHHFDYF